MRKKIFYILLFIYVFIPHIHAIDTKECEVSESYLEWSKLSEEERSKYITPAYCASNGLEDFEIETDTSKNKLLLSSNYPSYFISTSSPVKNQKQTNTCWAFASTSVVESFALKKYNVSLELSPGHLNYMESQSFSDISSNPKGITRYVNDGGTYEVSSLYYISRFGPVYESESPTNTDDEILPKINSKDIFGKVNRVNVNNIEYEYRDKSGPCTNKEIDRIKYLLYNKGPTGASVYITEDYINANNSLLFKTTNKTVLTNHAVMVIGWDDNYSASNFNGIFRPQNNGAWIVQNSWGNEWGDNGLLYVSYEDDSVCSNIFGIRDADGDTFDNKYIYTHDYSSNFAIVNTAMNVFNKKQDKTDEFLNKVSFKVNKPGNYKVYYYKGDAAKDKVKPSKMKLIASGSIDYSGWVSITPSSSIVIPKSTSKYSIAVYQSSKIQPLVNKYQKFLYSNGSYDKVLSSDKFKKKMSYVYVNGKWKDLYNYYSNGKFKSTIMSFTDNVFVDIKDVKVKYSYNNYFDVDFKVKAKLNGTISDIKLVKDNNVIVENTDLNMNVVEGNTYNLSIRKNNLTNFVNGKYELRVYTSNGIYKLEKVDIKVIPISGVSITNKKGLKLEVGNTLKLNTSITPSNFNSFSPVLSYSSSDNSIASVSEDGIVTAKKIGNVKITVTTSNNKSDSYDLSIVKPITELKVNRTYLNLEVGDEENIWYFVEPYDTTDSKYVTWTSSDNEKVKIEYIDEENIKVKALSSGRVTLTGTTVNGISKNVNVLIKGLSIEPSNLTLELNNSYNLTGVIIDDQFNISNDVTWTSSNMDVLSIDSNGHIYAKKLGSSIVSASTIDDSVSMNIVVTKVQANSFKVSSVSNKTYNGKSIKPSVKVTYKGKTLKKDKNYKISYSNNKYPGKATIKITAKKSNLYEGSKKVYFIIKPKKETINKITTKSKSITIKYTKQTNVKYQISYRKKGSSTWSNINTSSSSYKITNLTKNKNYEVRVRSYVVVDNKNYYGSWSKTKSIKCK